MCIRLCASSFHLGSSSANSVLGLSPGPSRSVRHTVPVLRRSSIFTFEFPPYNASPFAVGLHVCLVGLFRFQISRNVAHSAFRLALTVCRLLFQAATSLNFVSRVGGFEPPVAKHACCQKIVGSLRIIASIRLHLPAVSLWPSVAESKLSVLRTTGAVAAIYWILYMLETPAGRFRLVLTL